MTRSRKTRTVYRYVGETRVMPFPLGIKLRTGQFISKHVFDRLSRVETIEQEITCG